MSVFLNGLDKYIAGTGRYSITHDAAAERPVFRAHLLFLLRGRNLTGENLARIRDMCERFRRSVAFESHGADGNLVTITVVPTLQ